MNLSEDLSIYKELFSGTLVEENTMNLSKRSRDKELFSGVQTKENTMNLSKRSGDKELFSGTLVEENTMHLKIVLYIRINPSINSLYIFIF
jgi:hypothetical protein